MTRTIALGGFDPNDWWWRMEIERALPLLQHVQRLQPVIAQLEESNRHLRAMPPQLLEIARALERSPLLYVARLLQRSPVHGAVEILQRHISISPVLQHLQAHANFAQHLEHTFLGSVFFQMQEAVERQATFAEALAIIQTAITRKSEAIKKPHHTDLVGILGILITLITFLLSLYYSAESEQRVISEVRDGNQKTIDAIRQAEQNILDALTARIAPEESGHFSVVRSRVTLFRNRRTRSPKIATLYKNQMVETIKREQEWVYVRYFDYVDAIPPMGWAKKKYFKKIERKLSAPNARAIQDALNQ